MTTPITNRDDMIDTRDLIARIEDLEGEREGLTDDVESCEEALAEYLQTEGASPELMQESLAAAEAALKAWDDENLEELTSLQELAKQCESLPDYRHGEQLIRDSYFAEHIEQLINDCYDMPKEMKSGEWPWRHMTLDLAAAAEEAHMDYTSVDFDGVTYWVRG